MLLFLFAWDLKSYCKTENDRCKTFFFKKEQFHLDFLSNCCNQGIVCNYLIHTKMYPNRVVCNPWSQYWNTITNTQLYFLSKVEISATNLFEVCVLYRSQERLILFDEMWSFANIAASSFHSWDIKVFAFHTPIASSLLG